MSATALAISGTILISVMLVLLIKFKILPITVFSTLPLFASLALGFGLSGSLKMVAYGIIDVLPIAALFVGSITFFGIITDMGVFERPVNWLTKKITPKLFYLYLLTIAITIIGHLDGSGTTTLLIVVPALLPLVKKYKIRVMPVAFISTTTMAIMNLLPWAGPIGRIATVTGVEATEIWKQVLPLQVIGIIMMVVYAFVEARHQEKMGCGCAAVSHSENEDTPQSDSGTAIPTWKAQPVKYWANLALLLIVIALLFAGVPAFIPFLVGVGIALPMNYWGDPKAQQKSIAKQGKNVLPIVVTIIGAGMLLGVMNDSGMIEAMSNAIVSVLPASLGKFLPVLSGIISTPLTIVFEADSLLYGIAPVIAQVGDTYGISMLNTAIAMAIGHNFGTGICLTNAALYFGLGLWGVDYRESIKFSFLRSLSLCTILIVIGALIGVI